MIEGHGDDLFRYKGRVRINFSSNIPQKVNHAGLLKHLYECGAIFSNYPEPEPRSIEERLAVLYGLSDGNVIVTGGATEAIYLLAHLFSGQKSAIIVPTFREYQDACKVFSHTVLFISSLSEIETCEAEIVWLCNPNNPTGMVYNHRELLDVIDRFPDKVFVIDQAYALYSIKPVLSADDMSQRDNVVLLGSLTKRFVVPGLRIGYALGPVEIIGALRNMRMPWSVSSIAIEAAHYLLENAEEYKIDTVGLHLEALRLAKALQNLGIEAQATDCNFLLACLPDRTAADLKEWLVEHYGILIRDASNFEGLTPQHFRIAAQSAAENDLLIKALGAWIAL